MVQQTLYLDALQQKMIDTKSKSIRFVRNIKTDLEDYDDPFEDIPMSLMPPGNLGILPKNYMKFFKKGRAEQIILKKYPVKILKSGLFFLPFWLGKSRKTEENKSAVYCLDAVLGSGFTPPVIPTT